MTKQEFMAISLPYGLNGIDGNGDVAELIAYDIWGYFATDIDIEQSEEAMNVLEGNFKIILHPLSDLTKEIEHKGEKFVPMKVIWSLVYPKFKSRTFDFRITTDSIFCHSLYTGYDCHLYTKNIEKNYFWKVQKLIEWHFDVAGLIEKGEAIDVNTLSENPYK